MPVCTVRPPYLEKENPHQYTMETLEAIAAAASAAARIATRNF